MRSSGPAWATTAAACCAASRWLLPWLDGSQDPAQKPDKAKNDFDKAMDSLGKAIADGIATVESWFGIGGPPAGAHARRAAGGGGGIGSYIYWQVVELVAPQIGSALSGLDAARSQLSAMPAGPARTQAVSKALEQFFRTFGNVDNAFQQVDTALYVLLAGTLLVTVAGAGAIAAIAAVVAAYLTVPITLVAAITFVGASAFGGLTTLGATIFAAVQDKQGVDLAPDDRGLKAAIQGLYGLNGTLNNAIGLPVAPQADASPDAIGAYQRQLDQMKQDQRDLAEAQVEFDRLKCHLDENIAYYGQLTFQSKTEAALRDFIASFVDAPGVVEPRVAGFMDSRAAFRVLDMSWLALSGFDYYAAMKNLTTARNASAPIPPATITMPTPGVTIEPRLGDCEACDSFIEAHRTKDLALKDEEVNQAQIETDRRRKRVAASLLDDPVDHDARVTLSVNAPPVNAPAQGGAPAAAPQGNPPPAPAQGNPPP
jgi:hypothetical protein